MFRMKCLIEYSPTGRRLHLPSPTIIAQMNKAVLFKSLYESLGAGHLSGHKKAEHLDEITAAHPYFFVGHFLKLLHNNDDSRDDQSIKKTALPISNEAWLNFLLDGTDTFSASNPFQKESDTIEYVQDEVTEHIASIMEPSEYQKEPDLEEAIPNEFETEQKETFDEEASSEKISSILQEQLLVFEKAVEADAIIPIETAPFYRVDYFASQGIKFENPTADGDALEAKTRRFTDWLRHIRHINPNPTDLGTDAASEKKIVALAGQSIENPEIITEAMAQVLERQGKYQKAIRLYEKLSFLNPSKNAFFASKIVELSNKL